MLVEAAAVAAIFHGYVRVADGTGIPVDELVVATSADVRDRLGVNDFAGRVNTDLAVPPRPAADFDPALDARDGTQRGQTPRVPFDRSTG